MTTTKAEKAIVDIVTEYNLETREDLEKIYEVFFWNINRRHGPIGRCNVWRVASEIYLYDDSLAKIG